MFRPLLATAVLLGSLTVARAEDFEREPINYSQAQPCNVISRLESKIKAGAKLEWAFDREWGYLPSLLKALDVPTSSQVLVFSKTSLQRHRIGPRTPRAIYFSDDLYVGYCQRGGVLEISAVDPQLGTVFYSVDQQVSEVPKFTRHTDSCLICHGSSQTRGVPGHLVRSVFVDRSGMPMLSSGSYRIDHTSPFEKRWGGWYVTGTHGKQTHLGNLILSQAREPEQVRNPDGQNVQSLKERFDTSAYLTPHSDLVALMVLEHQAEMHNQIARMTLLTRQALYDEEQLNKELGRPADYRSETTTRRIKSAGDALVKYLLFSNEARLSEPVAGTTAFAQEFSRRGPRDSQGRSLRDFDLAQRLFQFPCSYLIYSEAFEGMPEAAREMVLRRVYDVLHGRDYSRDFEHLSTDDRTAILEILRATKKDLPAYWHAGT